MITQIISQLGCGFFGESIFEPVSTVLAYRPFLDPLYAYAYWWLFLFPLLIGISIVYKAIRLPTLDNYWKQVTKMTAQVFIAMIVMAVCLYFIVQVIVVRI